MSYNLYCRDVWGFFVFFLEALPRGKGLEVFSIV